MRPALLVLALIAPQAPSPETLTLEVRVFNGIEDVTADTRVAVHRAGERGEPVSQMPMRDGARQADVPPGIYDIQLIRERDGRVVSIRWAERLVVMPYPDEGGRHLEVVNFVNGYGALQIRAKDPDLLHEVTVHAPEDHARPAVEPVKGVGYALFILKAGKYDIQIRSGPRSAWHTGIEVPLDRTRLWVVR